jgi:hypothetical protein
MKLMHFGYWSCQQVEINLQTVLKRDIPLGREIWAAWSHIHPDARQHLLDCKECQEKYDLVGGR